MYTIICCSIDPAAAERLRRNIADTIGAPFEFKAVDNRGRNEGICSVYNRSAAEARYDYLCFVHEDVRFDTPDWGPAIAAELARPDCGVIGFAGSIRKLARLTAWNGGTDDLRAHYIQHMRGRKHLHAVDPDGRAFSPVVTLDGMCLIVRRDLWDEVRFDSSRFPGFHSYDLDFTTAVFARGGVSNRVCHTVLVEHFSEGNYTRAWFESLCDYHAKWAGRLPLGVDLPIADGDLARIDRKAEAYFIKLLWQKGLFEVCGWPDLKAYCRRYPFRAALWALPFKYFKYRIKHLLRPRKS